MGHYTGIATRLKVKKTAPAELITFLDQFYTKTEESESRAIASPNKTIEDMVDMLSRIGSQSSSHEGWCWRVKEDCGDYWLYESRGDSKHSPDDEFKSLVEGIVEWLVIDIGDIVYITIYEDDVTEEVWYWNGTSLVKRDGWKYKHDNGYVTDCDHPWSDDLTTADKLARKNKTFDHYARHEYGNHLVWSVAELDAKIAKKKRREEREWKLELARRHKNPGFY